MHMCALSHGFAKIPGITDPSPLTPFGVGYKTTFDSDSDSLTSYAGKDNVRSVSSTASFASTVTKIG